MAYKSCIMSHDSIRHKMELWTGHFDTIAYIFKDFRPERIITTHRDKFICYYVQMTCHIIPIISFLSLGRPRRRWETIRMALKEIGTNTSNWGNSAQDRVYWRTLVNAALNLRV